MAAAVYLKSHLPALQNVYFFRCEMVQLVRAWVPRAADGTSLKTRCWAYRRSWKNTKIHRGVFHGRQAIIAEVPVALAILRERNNWNSRQNSGDKHDHRYFPK